MKYIDLIRDLTNAKGAPGFEDEVLAVLNEYKGNYDFKVDNLKNGYYNLNKHYDSKPTVMLDSHTDEVALMVRGIDDNGLLLIQPLGGWMPAHISGQHYLVRNSQGQYYSGISTSKPIHFLTEAERAKTLTIDDLKIDVGAQNRDQVINDFQITVGQPIVPATQFEVNEENQVMLAKAFDNRIGVAVAVAVMAELQEELGDLPFNLVSAFAAQEEVGIRGATITAKRVQPDLAIVFEGTPSDDFTAGATLEQAKLGHGPQLRYRDSSYVAHEGMLKWFSEAAATHDIPMQHAVRVGGGTNAGTIHLQNLGIPCATIGTPSRYVHTNVGYASYQDFENAVKLTIAFLKGLTAEDFQSLQLQDYPEGAD